MTLQGRQVAVIGAGVAGLAAADALAVWNPSVTIIEKAASAGGHAGRFNCKATDRCVACGACLAEQMRRRVHGRDNVRLLAGAAIERITADNGYAIDYRQQGRVDALHADAILVTSGFTPYDPCEKPYGHGLFADVCTSLEAEGIVRGHGRLLRPSDGREPERIAFIQCVGSRDLRIGHPWCSKICCGAALRMAKLIQHRRPATSVTFFYIDVQTFGRNFDLFYHESRRQVEMVRAIPGDIRRTDDEKLLAVYFDPETHRSVEAVFDLVVLSVGLMPSPDNADLARMLAWPLTQNGFLESHRNGTISPGSSGIFIAGAALGPMSIAESMDSAGHAAADILRYLEMTAEK